MANARLYPFWANLTDDLRTGGTAERGQDRRRPLAHKFPWGGYRSLVDVGCAEGGVPVAIASANSHLRGTGFELPAVRPHFEAFVRKNRVADRLSFDGGAFLADALPASMSSSWAKLSTTGISSRSAS